MFGGGNPTKLATMNFARQSVCKPGKPRDHQCWENEIRSEHFIVVEETVVAIFRFLVWRSTVTMGEIIGPTLFIMMVF